MINWQEIWKKFYKLYVFSGAFFVDNSLKFQKKNSLYLKLPYLLTAALSLSLDTTPSQYLRWWIED